MQGREISELLRQAVTEGRLDSSGHFTLDANRTGKKLTHFELPTPAAYLLRWVQAALGCAARYVQVFLRRGQLLLVATLNKPTPFQAEDLWQRLDAPVLGKEPVDALCAGLRACLNRNPDVARVFLFDSQELLSTEKSGWRIDRLGQPGAFRQWLGYDSGFAVQMEWKWWLFAPKLADEHQTLWDFCRFAPCPILLDNVPVNDPGFYATRCPLAIHYQYDSQANLPAPAPTSLRSGVHDPGRELYHSWVQGAEVTHPMKFRNQPSARVRWVAYVPTSHFALRYQAGLYPVIGGVAADWIPLDGLPDGTVVQLWADDLDTDLSGLRLIENARFKQRVVEITAHLNTWGRFQNSTSARSGGY